MTIKIKDVLDEREERYGSFASFSWISRDLKLVINTSLEERDKELKPYQQEALEMICHKIARIINGDADYIDNWVDIAGYATLVANRLQSEQTKNL